VSDEQISNRVAALLEEFVRRHLGGEAPDPLEFARRAGEESGRVRELIALFLAESEPVLPNPAAARALAERYAQSPEPVSAGEGESAIGWSKALHDLVEQWISATAEIRQMLIDQVAAASPVLQLEPSGHRGTTAAGDSPQWTAIQLDHPQGGKAEVRGADLVIVLYGVPAEFLGSRPLIAFPRAQLPDVPALCWAGDSQGLPPGLVRADAAVEERGELRVKVGELRDSDGSLESLLTGIRVILDCGPST
jgi:hypothetical protein